MRQLFADTASAFGISEGDVLLIIPHGSEQPCSLAGSDVAMRAVDAGFIGDVEARRSPPPTRVVVRFVTETSAPSE
jgi:hypothetical protein